jgi:hypothetical protein
MKLTREKEREKIQHQNIDCACLRIFKHIFLAQFFVI